MAVCLVCEGLRNGLDDRVLDALVVQFHRLTVLIEPAGGGTGCRAVRAYLESSPSHNAAVAVEDRDFRPRTTANATWTNQAGRSFIWRRHEIENCLLHPRVVMELFNDLRSAGASGANSLPATEADVSALLQTLASPLIEDHAAAVLKDELVRLTNSIGSLSFSPPRLLFSPGSAHTCTRAEWAPALQKEATRLCQPCGNLAAFADLQPAAITAQYGAH